MPKIAQCGDCPFPDCPSSPGDESRWQDTDLICWLLAKPDLQDQHKSRARIAAALDAYAASQQPQPEQPKPSNPFQTTLDLGLD